MPLASACCIRSAISVGLSPGWIGISFSDVNRGLSWLQSTVLSILIVWALRESKLDQLLEFTWLISKLSSCRFFELKSVTFILFNISVLRLLLFRLESELSVPPFRLRVSRWLKALRSSNVTISVALNWQFSKLSSWLCWIASSFACCWIQSPSGLLLNFRAEMGCEISLVVSVWGRQRCQNLALVFLG